MGLRLSILILLVTMFSVSVLPQSSGDYVFPVLKSTSKIDGSEDLQVGEVRGNIKTTAVYLPKPAYPDKAKDLGIEGSVQVGISIDDQGNVTKSSVLSGATELKVVAEDAAARSKFRMYRDATGQAIAIDGILTYTFEIKKAGWAKIGFDLGSLQKFPVSPFTAVRISKAIDPNWTDEFLLAEKLKAIGRANPGTPAILALGKPLLVSRSVTSASLSRSANSQTTSTSVVLPSFRTPSPDQVSTAMNLIDGVKLRLADDKLGLWQFELGLGLQEIFHMTRAQSQMINPAKKVDDYLNHAPVSASTEMLKALGDLKKLLEKTGQRSEDGREIINTLAAIFQAK